MNRSFPLRSSTSPLLGVREIPREGLRRLPRRLGVPLLSENPGFLPCENLGGVWYGDCAIFVLRGGVLGWYITFVDITLCKKTMNGRLLGCQKRYATRRGVLFQNRMCERPKIETGRAALRWLAQLLRYTDLNTSIRKIVTDYFTWEWSLESYYNDRHEVLRHNLVRNPIGDRNFKRLKKKDERGSRRDYLAEVC